MAFPAGMGERSDDARFRNPSQSPRDESSFASITSPLRSVGTMASNDARGQLHRRFTTNNIPTLNTPLSPIGQQRRQAAEPAEFTTATYHKLQVLEKKKLEYEYLKEQRRRFEAEMELIDLQSRQEEAEISRLASDITYGKHSQPTTPPEHNDSNGFPTSLSRPNRFSMSSITPGMTTPRGSRANSYITSPPSSTAGAQATTNGFLPSKSMPGSRRGSDEEADGFEHEDFAPMSPVFRSNNRMSMPVNLERSRRNDELPDLASVLGHIDTASFLFDDESKQPADASSKSYLHMNTTDDKFPILVRRDGNSNNGMQLSASSAALDLALSQSPGPDASGAVWPSRHRQHPSLPTNTLRNAAPADEHNAGAINGNVEMPPTKAMANNRRSVEFNFNAQYNAGESKRSSYHGATNGMPKLQQSYSTNDVPTLKNGNGVNGMNGMNGMNGGYADQHFHNHNASLGRIPQNAMSNRHSRELSVGLKDQDSAYRSLQSGLHASAAPFGPSMTSAGATNGVAATMSSPAMTQYSSSASINSMNTAPYYGYAMSALNSSMNGMSIGSGSQYGAPPSSYSSPVVYPGIPYNPYTTYGPSGRVQDSQARVIQSRRLQNDANRFMNYDLKTMPRNEIYSLCKDQHGCRFLQKKLEEHNPEYLEIIFEETAPHVVELMTDPFGNYLCQKLLEYTNHEQRNTLVRNASPSLVQIALNQHGTRALQKMIEFISTAEQIQMIIGAFEHHVVDLIQDLNGNHVIQKCLNHLKAEDAQFIFDAVGQNCVTVGTHRHGCCVLQRCLDHASGFQKVQLVRQITDNSVGLVQDPFGNYVVQYILDLNDASFTAPMCIGFQGKIAELSKQKFSSNVIEKCIRCADMTTKRILIEELMDLSELEKLMRDSYGNYVIQTALEFAPPDLCLHLIEAMRPILPQIRQTPYGRRIQSKVQERESRLAAYTGRTSGHVSPHNTMSTTQSPEMAVAFTSQLPGSSSFQSPPMYAVANAYGSNIASPQPHRLSNPPLPSHLQNSVQNQAYQQYGHAHSNGMGNFF
ncbi:ARM repeat-containing protein [Amniculicola lignicola CBS 123094]|uniref:ARM repeat-containing protein n=1 Tax=Amniculicola lignicola CBS 123094 TaxID=1392246 RepID=A0A6A5WLC7_9PLEO|nr:ARM repeat-containing protein [Amniculicola lignicola CBS 123094]